MVLDTFPFVPVRMLHIRFLLRTLRDDKHVTQINTTSSGVVQVKTQVKRILQFVQYLLRSKEQNPIS